MSKKVVVAFGRYNPMSIGHEKLFDAMYEISKRKNAGMKIYASHSQDSSKNPLEYDQKLKFLKAAFPRYQKFIIRSNAKTIFDVFRELQDQDYTDVILVAGEDRVKEFEQMIKPYLNTNHPDALKFDHFDVVSAGDRDPDSDDIIEGISASKLREFAAMDDFKSFKLGLPKALSEPLAKQLFQLVRTHMGKKDNLNIKEFNAPHPPYGGDAVDIPSRMLRTFRQWFYIDQDDFVDEEDHSKSPDSDFLVVDKKSGERHLPIKRNGKIDNNLLGAAWASLHKGYRGNKYKGPNKGEALSKLKALYKQAGQELPKE